MLASALPKKTMQGPHLFPMKDGTGDTSYANYCSFQKAILTTVRPLLDEAILDFLRKNFPDCFTIADLGCSSGQNTLLLISHMIDVIRGTMASSQGAMPELQVYLNDLPDNDFNTLFKFLPSFYHDLAEKKGHQALSCFISAWPGSFYERIFPRQSVHIVHSSSSIHWLSQVPPGIKGANRRDIYISASSPPAIREAYLHQFQRDFTKFLRLRSEEMVPGGRMLLSLLGRPSPGHADDKTGRFMGILGTALLELAAEGLINKDDIESFNMSLYLPYIGEVKDVIDTEGSFATDRLEIYELDFVRDERAEGGGHPIMGGLPVGEAIGRTFRAVMEPSLTYHFGGSHMDYIFERYAKVFARKGIDDTNVVMISIALTNAAEKM